MVGRRPVVEAIRAGRAGEILISEDARDTEGLREVRRSAERAGVPLLDVSGSALDRLGPRHQGVAARVRHPSVMGERDLRERNFGPQDVVVLLDGITDPQNLGAAARTAEAAGAAMLVTRQRRAAGVTPSAVRTSAGALLHLPHAQVPNLTRAIKLLKERGFSVVGLDADAPVNIYEEPCPEGRVVLVVGAEGPGISRLVRESCDVLVALPMRGKVSSLNASASLAAALFAYVLPGGRQPPGLSR